MSTVAIYTYKWIRTATDLGIRCWLGVSLELVRLVRVGNFRRRRRYIRGSAGQPGDCADISAVPREGQKGAATDAIPHSRGVVP